MSHVIDAYENVKEQVGDYEGTPTHFAIFYDGYDERHVALKMSTGYVLDWIGGEYAEGPDECDLEYFEERHEPKWYAYE